MTRRNLLALPLAPMLAPLMAWLPGQREPVDYIADASDYPLLGENWSNRPTNAAVLSRETLERAIEEWRKEHPGSHVMDCARYFDA